MVVDASTKRQFSQRVASLREKRELTQAELGQIVGVTGTCVWNWEGANTYPRRGATMKRLAEALGTTVTYLSGAAASKSHEQDQESGPNRSLAEIIMVARQSVAAAAGLPVSKVRVVLDCGD